MRFFWAGAADTDEFCTGIDLGDPLCSVSALPPFLFLFPHSFSTDPFSLDFPQSYLTLLLDFSFKIIIRFLMGVCF